MDKDTKKQFEKLSKQITGVKQDLQTQMTGLKQDLHKEITGVKQDLQTQMTGVKAFLYKEMPTKKEMGESFLELPTKQDLNLLQTSVDAYAKQSKDYYQEVTVLVAKVNRMEIWIREVSSKVGVKYQV